MDVLHIPTQTHGRVLVEAAAGGAGVGLLVAFHGYAQTAEDALADARAIPGAAAWRLVAIQGLHRFYSRKHQHVVASWMTRQDRDLAIADNVAYIDRALEAVGAPVPQPVVFMGFSQGASMAHRAARLGARPASGVMAIAGDIPPEQELSAGRRSPPVFIGAGDRDEWYTAAKLGADVSRLQGAGVPVQVARFHGGHEWTPELRDAAAGWLAGIAVG